MFRLRLGPIFKIMLLPLLNIILFVIVFNVISGAFFFFFPKSPANHYCYWFMFNIGGEDRFISWAADWVTHGILYYRKHTHTIDNTFCKDHSWAADSVDAWRSILQRTHSVDDTLKKKTSASFLSRWFSWRIASGDVGREYPFSITQMLSSAFPTCYFDDFLFLLFLLSFFVNLFILFYFFIFEIFHLRFPTFIIIIVISLPLSLLLS